MDIDVNNFKDKGFFSPFAYVENFLSEEEINKLSTDIVLNKSFVHAREDNLIKKTNLINISDNQNCFWLIDKIKDISNFINKHYFGFEINQIVDLQVNILKKRHFYKLHSDVEYNVPLEDEMKKITFIIQLSNESEFEGGDTILYYESNSIKFLKTKGLMFLFPSTLHYEIETILSGEKKILIGWITGKR